MTAEEVVLSEVVHRCVVVLVARHDEHSARLHILGDLRHLFAAVHPCFRLGFVGIQLGAQKPLRQDMEKRLLRRQANIVVALRPIEAKPGALTSSKDHDTDFAGSDKVVAGAGVYGLIVGAQVSPVDDSLRLNRIERSLLYNLVSTRGRVFD